MKKNSVKAIILILLILLLILIIQIIGINAYKYKSAIVDDVTSSGSLNQNIDTNIPNINKNYYYKQLNAYSRIIYNTLEINKENLKTGKCVIKFGNEFFPLLDTQNGSELLQKYYQSAMETYLYDNTDVFFINPAKMYINIRTIKKLFSTDYEVFIDSGNYSDYFADGYKSAKQILLYEEKINQEVENILQKVQGKGDYEKIKIVHDYLVDNISYDETISKDNIYNIYGALVNKEAVCEGYAKAFKYLMDKCGIECIVVTGDATDALGNVQNHAWNYVKLDEKWYAVDVTWDDPLLIGGGTISNRHKYKYFLKGSTTINVDHVQDTTFIEDGQVYSYPTLSVEDYK